MTIDKHLTVRVDRTGTRNGLAALLAEMEQDERVAGILLLACDQNGFHPQQVDASLTALNKPVFGGIFPEIIYEEAKLTTGTIAVGLTRPPRLLVVPGLSDENADFDAFLDAHASTLGPGHTMFVWVDGLAGRISALVDSLFHIFGLQYNFIGGGAGSLTFAQKPCLLTNQGLIGDCAVLAVVDMPSGIGVSHGWSSISGPHKVTRAEGTVIRSLNWRPAFEVYQEVVAQATGQTITKQNFFALSKSHPFGIIRIGDEMIVRDPIVVREDGALVCVGEVPEECHVDILVGDPDSLVGAAQRALALGKEAFRSSGPPGLTFFVDCISRVLFLEDGFGRELAAVHSREWPLVGALTLGEIANSGRNYLEFYNKTAVVGILGV